MSWASGGSVLVRVWTAARGYVDEKDRVPLLVLLMTIFADEGRDTLGEVVCEEWPESAPAYALWSDRDRERR